MADKTRVGVITHFFPKVSVAVVKLEGELAVGQRVRIERGDEGFEQTIDSMQVEHRPVQKGDAGNEIAIKAVQPTKAGAVVYKI